MLSNQRKLLLKHLLISQLYMESVDDCINERIIRQKEKQEAKRFMASMEKMHKDNLSAMYQIDSQSFVNLTHIIESTIEEISDLSLEEHLTLNKEIHGIIEKIRQSTTVQPTEQSGVDDVHQDNNGKI